MTTTQLDKFLSAYEAAYAYIISFNFNKEIIEGGILVSNVKIFFTKHPGDSEILMEMLFSNVTDLLVGDLMASNSIYVSVEDITSWGREGAKFSVSTEEDTAFSFKCDSINIRFSPRPQSHSEFI